MAKASKTLAAFCNHDPALIAIAEGISARLGAAWNRGGGEAPPERYVRLLAAADVAIEEQKARATGTLPCKAGCNHCCKFQRIILTETEAVLAVRHVEGLAAEERASLVGAIMASTPTGVDNAPCAFLTDRGCAIYPARPAPCRGYYSLSEPACRAFLEHTGPPPQNLLTTRIVELAVLETARAFRHSRFYEINRLMQRIYSGPSKPVAWAAGNPTGEDDLTIDTKEILGG